MASNPHQPRRSRRAPAGSGSPAARRPGRAALLIIAGVVVSAVLAAINGLQLASLQRATGGLAMPDTLLTGYDSDYITRVQSRMTDELYERYGASHYLWDVLFPVVFAATVMLLISTITRGRKIRWFLLPVPVVYVVVDITENLLLEAVFAAESLGPGAVAAASTFTILKFVLFAAAVAAGLAALLTRPKNAAPPKR
ncbi:hypothetical protein [Arthrobacter zhaoguopingii]|uniref:hypothetical protein n=1 Tax=Arthrobacter zhaoguopingii TaxID=2681491 RepID=UPI00135B112B|nr:hypothetical protein [Arthrobacter zhaoguopingii]